MSATRREALLSGLFGAGYIGLRALATGLPISVLANPRAARADAACMNKDKAQYIILATSGSGDPMNANVPGTFDYPEAAHSADPAMAKTTLTIRGQSYTAAKPWADLPQSILDRTCFFHAATQTNSHANEPKVMRLMGATKRSEMLVSLIARQLAPCLGTVQKEPVLVSGNVMTYEGRVLPILSPTSLRDALISPKGPMTDLQKLRDADLDRLNALFKQSGTPAQKTILDRLALSQQEIRSLSQQLIDSLSAIKTNDAIGQAAAAVILIQMNASPVVAMTIPFGGDNHGDSGLVNETRQTVSGVATIAALQQQLSAVGLQDRVTFMAMNVFGRPLLLNTSGGRDHWANHHCTILIGKGVKGSVVGGIEPMPKGGGFIAQAIDSKTGRGGAGGDIAFTDGLASVGKTLAAAVGVPPEVYNDQITSGKAVGAALA